ncbi:MAG TPA: serine--tRNA ligase [Candidatus Nanoarchaeia archaeon]|nr:serine--tRNA ligase [Candidatus Nanoarchaeia archaeon]
MIDINLIRENPKRIKENIQKKYQDTKLPFVDEILEKDKKWRKLKNEVDILRADRNKISREINEAKKAGKNPSILLKKAKKIPKEIEEKEKEMQILQTTLQTLLAKIPNLIHSSVPSGKSDKENKELEKIGKISKPSFEIKNHAELIESLNLADFNSSATTSGNGFYYLQGDLALLNQALIRFATEKMVKAGFTYIETPLMLRSGVINKVTDLNDQQNQIYKIEGEDLHLIGTSEHSLIGRFIDTILPESQLPIKHTSYSMCFRKEIGAHGIDQKGLYRTHQFNKVEMIIICTPENSMKHWEEIKQITIDIFKDLGIPIRVLAICSGDLGDLKHIQVDIEAWSPKKQEYFEVGSCSNLTDAQARKLKIRVDGKGKRYIPHTLNNTAIATSRALVAILENYQNKDGTITIPKVLLPYMFGKTKLEKET